MAAKRRALAERRKAAGYSQEALAEVLYIEPSTVGRWERGETIPQPWFRPRLARALGVSCQALAELLSDVAEPVSVVSASGPTAEEVETLLRRDFMGTVAGLAVSMPPITQPTFSRQLGSAQVAQLLNRTARFRRLDDVLGASYTSSTGRALLAVLAEQAQLAGWAAFDAGMHRGQATLSHELERC